MGKCNCHTCKLADRINKEKLNWTKETLDIVKELWASMECAEVDAVYWEEKFRKRWNGMRDSKGRFLKKA